jgi:hypothetical protein
MARQYDGHRLLLDSYMLQAERFPLGAVVRQQPQQLRDAEAGSVAGDQRVQAIPAGPVAAGTGGGQDRDVASDLIQSNGARCHAGLGSTSAARRILRTLARANREPRGVNSGVRQPGER